MGEKIYKLEVEEYHLVNKTYYIRADNKKDARKKAKNQGWFDASADEHTGIVSNVIVKSIVEEYE